MPSLKSTARHLTLVAGLLLAGVASTHAADAPATRPQRPGQGGARDPGMALKFMRQRLDALDLSADQSKKLDAIYASAADDLKKGDADPAARRTVLVGVREKTLEVLTDAQKEKYQAMGPAMGGAGAARPGSGSMVERIRQNIDKIGLDDGQKTKAIAVLDDAQKKIDALKAEIENGNADQTQLREKGLQISTDTRQKLMDITTTEQQAKLRALLNADGGTPPPRRGAATRPAKG